MLITVSSSNSGGSSWDRAFECQRRLLLIYLHLICPTGRRFWLWRRDLSKTEPLASVRVSAAAVVAQHIFATLMTPTRDYIHSYTDHRVISLEARRHSSCTIQDVCRIFATRHFYFLKTNISISKANAKGCSFITSSLFSKKRDTFTVLSCTHFHDILLNILLWCKSKS